MIARDLGTMDAEDWDRPGGGVVEGPAALEDESEAAALERVLYSLYLAAGEKMSGRTSGCGRQHTYGRLSFDFLHGGLSSVLCAEVTLPFLDFCAYIRYVHGQGE